MAREKKATTFVTGADGFFGTELLKVLVADGHRVFGLAPSPEAAQRVRRAGGQAVIGDLLEPGQWQDETAAEWVFHLPPHPLSGGRVTRRRAASIAHARVGTRPSSRDCSKCSRRSMSKPFVARRLT